MTAKTKTIFVTGATAGFGKAIAYTFAQHGWNILLNGRRLSPAGSRGQLAAADLNVLPESIIQRTEILKDGASSVYGSDAVAGVINIITRRPSENGVAAHASFGTNGIMQ